MTTAPACAVLPLTVLDPIEHWADTTSGNAARCGAALQPGAAGSAAAAGKPRDRDCHRHRLTTPSSSCLSNPNLRRQ